MKRILLIQTGGTIAMDIGKGTENPELNIYSFSELLHKEIPELSGIAELEVDRLFFEDSSDIHHSHWTRLIESIQDRYDEFDGFVILHGTDTMVYTASALSFGLQNLGKPVILTGSQVPMSNIRSDARRNLVNSIEMATLSLPEVAICFNDYVYRGNRTTKMSIGDFDAFASPNFPPLAEIGLNIELNRKINSQGGQLKVSPRFNDQVFLLKLFPSLNPAFLDRINLGNIKALVIEAFGSGNFPMKDEYSLLPFFQKCVGRNILLILTSQAAYDAVDLSKYESGREALKLGAISARDMTTEATVTKIMYLLGNHHSDEEITSLFQQNLAGEMTE